MDDLDYIRRIYRERRKLLEVISELDEARREGDRKADARVRRQKRWAIVLAVVGILVNSAVLTLIWWLLNRG